MALDIRDFINSFFEPMTAAVASPEDFVALLRDLGINAALSETQTDFVQETLGLVAVVEALASALEGVADGDISAEDTEALFAAVQTAARTLKSFEIPTVQAIAGFPEPLNDRFFWEGLGPQLGEYLLLTWIEADLTPVYEGLHFLGVIDEVPRDPGLPPSRHLRLEHLAAMLQNPADHLAMQYGWGGAFAHSDFILNLSRLLDSVGLYPQISPLRDTLADPLLGSGAHGLYRELSYPASGLARVLPGLSLDAVLAPYAPGGGDVSGLALVAAARSGLRIDLEPVPGWRAEAAVSGSFAMGAGLSPAGLDPIIGAGEANLDVSVRYVGPPIKLLGKEGGTRLEFLRAQVGVSAFLSETAPVFGVDVGLGSAAEPGMRMVIVPGDGDRFLADVLGDQALEVDLGLAMSWTSDGTVQIEGGAGFEIDLPVDMSLGPVRVDTVHARLRGGPTGLDVELAVTGGLDIAVISISVEEIGVAVALTARTDAGEEGNLGPLDMGFAFKSPKGLGLAVNASGIVTGGGYLFLDAARGEYAGIGQIGFTKLKLTAIGMLSTRVPDIPAGWSLFLSVFSEFPPLPLGFGITLNGVGGLVGLHRSFNDEALRDRLADGALNAVMFPDDPIANAPRILDDLRAIFPPAPGQFVFGAMMQLGWGTPTLVTADLGVIVEFPDPIKVALLGAISVALPTAEAAIVELNMDVFGVANITEGTLALDATLRDSHVLHLFTLSGDMALRARFGERPSFLFSMGGFHPDFQPPEGTPALARLSASLPLGDAAAVELRAYFAVTSNTFQVGGRVDVWVRVSGFTAEGWFGFDALIQFSPFSFEFRIYFGVTVSKGNTTLMGVDVHATVTGPGLWTVDGAARFKFLGIEQNIRVEIESGRRPAVAVTSYDVATMLLDALEHPDAWRVLGDSTGLPVMLLDLGDGAPAPLLPTDLLMVTQTVAPFDRALEKYGNGRIEGASEFQLNSVSLGGAVLSGADIDLTRDWFAPAQYFEMTDAEKLAAASFEEMTSGAIFGQSAKVRSAPVAGEDVYEEITIDTTLNCRSHLRDVAPSVRIARSSQGGAVKRLGTSKAFRLETRKPRRARSFELA